tara:strand:+ start:6124 stop:9885 length:3762 start_codon:yes stop_codon:yes gene_type:complete
MSKSIQKSKSADSKAESSNKIRLDTDTSSKLKAKSINETTEDSDLSKDFKRYINLYLEKLTKFPENNVPEFEVRFGTKKIKNITKVDFYNVIKILLNYDFKLNAENYYLRIINDHTLSNIRTQISGFPNIQSYCKLNNLSGIVDESNLQFVEKNYFKDDSNTYYPLNFDEYNFRISYQVEKYFNKSNSMVQETIDKWSSTKKIFRYIKRYEYIHPQLPFLIHCSIVKTSRSNYGKFIPEFNIKDSDVFNSLENFEIEIELNNSLIGLNTKYETGVYLHDDLKKVIKYILIGLQETNFPISISEQNLVTTNYLKLVKGKDYDRSRKPNIKDFIGPSSSTLQMINLLHEQDINDTNNIIPNIRKNYTVTDKADGMRKLLYINSNGKIYLISMSLNIQFTGCKTDVKELFDTIIDGEHIIHNKKNEYINTYAAFDIYFINTKNVTGLPFINLDDSLEKEPEKKPEKETEGKDRVEPDEEKESKAKKNTKESKDSRLIILSSVIKSLHILSVMPKSKPSLNCVVKKFYGNHIFNGCATILSNVDKGLYEYNTDGLIFTPSNTGVCSNKVGVAAPNYKITWNESFKWKPAEFNTIDFLVKFKKNDYGVNYIGNIYNDGKNLLSNNQVHNYYTLTLHVGFDEKKHGYINPCNDILNDYIKRNTSESYKNDYKPARFYPTNPSDENAGICNVIGLYDKANNLKIYTEEDHEIEDNTIIEFKYDVTKPEFWKWVPLRVRYDKTAELRSGIKNFGNAYHVANSNWQSIHNPITNKIISTGENITIDNNDDDIYYNKITNKTETRSLRDFHNLYVKNVLISKISKPGYTLIDYAAGKGGDLPKWINANLNFVLGIDLVKDNIENRLDGACARYLNYAQKYSVIPKAIFINGNSSANIKNGEALYTEKSKITVKALFGEGTKNEITLGRGVYNNYGIVKNGFNISSIQFALHYMFENELILNGFLKNVTQCTALNGYFIGTCYDGYSIFNMLNDVEKNESISLFKNDKKIWELTKRYDLKHYEDDESCLGYPIDIYQESINKTFREYLVNFKFLTRIMENYGFVLLNDDEFKQLGLPSSLGNFEELYNYMNLEIKMDKRITHKIGSALKMSDEEKKISYLNKYFIFKKIRNIDTDLDKQLEKTQIDKAEDETIEEQFDDIDKKVGSIEKSDIEEKSKKLAQKYIDSENSKKTTEELDKKSKISAAIDEKIQALEEKKKAKEAEKILKDAEKVKKAEEKVKKAEEKAKKTEEKKAKKTEEKKTNN